MSYCKEKKGWGTQRRAFKFSGSLQVQRFMGGSQRGNAPAFRQMLENGEKRGALLKNERN